MSLNAAGTGFHALSTVYAEPLQVRKQAADRGAHTVGAFYGAAVGFAADGAHSWHTISGY